MKDPKPRKGTRGKGAGGRSGSGRRPAGGMSAAERRRAVAELRVLAHPLRLRLFELFAEKPRTTMQVAEMLGEPPTRLYHHVNALEKAGLLRLRESRPIRGTVEKYFEAVHDGAKGAMDERITRSPSMRPSLQAAASAVLEQTRQDLLAVLRDPPAKGDPAPVLMRMLMVVPPAQAAEFRQRALDLIDEFRARAEAHEKGRGSRARVAGSRRWSLTVAFAPAWPPQPEEPGDEPEAK